MRCLISRRYTSNLLIQDSVYVAVCACIPIQLGLPCITGKGMMMAITMDKKGYGVHAGLRQLGLLNAAAPARPQVCGGSPTADCYRHCERGCYLPGYIPTPPYQAAAR